MKKDKTWVCDFNETDCILCVTKEQWNTIISPTKQSKHNWDIFKENTVYYPKLNDFKGQFSSLKVAKENGDKVYKFEEIES